MELGGCCHPVMKWLFWERNPEQRESSVSLGGQTDVLFWALEHRKDMGERLSENRMTAQWVQGLEG